MLKGNVFCLNVCSFILKEDYLLMMELREIMICKANL